MTGPVRNTPMNRLTLKLILPPCAAVIAAVTDVSIAGVHAPETALPDSVYFKTGQTSFTEKYVFAIHQGRIYYRANPDHGGLPERWQPFPPDGLPGRTGLRGFKSPESVSYLSADGDNLIALDADGAVYYAKLYDFVWTDVWGLFPKGTLKVPEGARALAVSHRGKNGVKYYEDTSGQKHEMSVGVTTLYLLDRDGGRCLYADPWLPPEFDHHICLPLKGRFVAENLSASGSTLFVSDRSGRMFTRLYDYDTAGENPLLPYTYEKIPPGEPGLRNRRALPAEDWLEQPPVPGRRTEIITIAQNGEGNSARELRVEGIDAAGVTGYYTKPLHGGRWKFVKTGHRLVGTVRNARTAAVEGKRITADYSGDIRNRCGGGVLSASLKEFSFYCEGGTLQTAAEGVTHSIPLHLRRVSRGKDSVSAEGALVLPDSLKNAHGGGAAALRRLLFGSGSVLAVRVAGRGDTVTLSARCVEMIFTQSAQH